MSEQRLTDADSLRQTLARHYLTANEVEQQAASGRVRMPAENRQYQQPAIDVKEEIAKVLHGFEARVFRVVVDGAIQESLDDDIILKRDSKVVFLRLMPLVGG